MTRSIAFILAFLISIPALSAAATTQPVIRAAIIGGMNETGFWDALAGRFEKQTGIHVDVVASGPANSIARIFRNGHIDFITMHASDAIINLVADGYVMDARPWARNDMIIVGPPADPAGIMGMTDAYAALKKIAGKNSPFVVHSSSGAQEVLQSLLDQTDLELDPDNTTVLFEDRQRLVLHIAAQKHAYTMIGRIPFLDGKIPNDGLVPMVSGDAHLRRPFMLAVANPDRIKDARVAEARKLAHFLLSPETQTWIGTYGKGKYDNQPLFFPIAPHGSPTVRP